MVMVSRPSPPPTASPGHDRQSLVMRLESGADRSSNAIVASPMLLRRVTVLT